MTVHVYKHEDGRSSYGAAAGTTIDEVLAADPAWTRVDPDGSASDQAADDQDDDGLDALTRSDLNARALKAGIEEPEKFANKQAVIDAIREA